MYPLTFFRSLGSKVLEAIFLGVIFMWGWCPSPLPICFTLPNPLSSIHSWQLSLLGKVYCTLWVCFSVRMSVFFLTTRLAISPLYLIVSRRVGKLISESSKIFLLWYLGAELCVFLGRKYLCYVFSCTACFFVQSTDKTCNPSLNQITNPDYNSTSSRVDTGDFTKTQFDAQSIIALIIWLFAVLYAR